MTTMLRGFSHCPARVRFVPSSSASIVPSQDAMADSLFTGLGFGRVCKAGFRLLEFA